MDHLKDLKQEYLRQSVVTATPAELTIMLFDGCIKNLKRAEIAMVGPADFIKTNEYLVKAQKIISELMSALDMNYELSGQLLPIYVYLQRTIRCMNVKKDLSAMPDVLNILTAQRDTWQQAVRSTNIGEGQQTCV